MNKTESAIVKKEIRTLKANLTSRAKITARELKKRRAFIRTTEREISAIERESEAFTKSTTDRLAILEGRINS